MIKERYAIRFPGMQDIGRNVPESPFSEKSIMTMKDSFLRTFDALENLTDLVVQKIRTHELSKQLKIREAAADKIIKNEKEQEKIKFEEHTKRLQIRLKYEKEKMEVEIKKISLETTRKIEEFSMTYEEAMRTNQILSAQLISVQLFLKENQSDIEFLAKDIYLIVKCRENRWN